MCIYLFKMQFIHRIYKMERQDKINANHLLDKAEQSGQLLIVYWVGSGNHIENHLITTYSQVFLRDRLFNTNINKINTEE